MTYVIDTHALLWYVTNNPQLSKRVEGILDDAHRSGSIIIVPSIVLVEAIDILGKGRVSYQIDLFLDAIKNSEQYIFAPITWEIMDKYKKVKLVLEIYDRLIVATAEEWNARILTKDKEITKHYGQYVVW